MTDGLYKLSVSIWILLGLASCASVVTTVAETYSTIAWLAREKATNNGDKLGSGHHQPSSPRSTSGSKRRVAPSDNDRKSETENDGENCQDDRISIT